MLREIAKVVVERGLVTSGWARMSRKRRRDEVLILAYHNIVPTEDDLTRRRNGKDSPYQAGDSSLHLPQRDFARQLDLLQDTHEIISLTDLLGHEIKRGVPSSRPRAVITFDDAYRGALTVGLAELRQRTLPMTMFVAPAYIGGKTFWWDVLTPPGAPGLSPEVREQALTADAGRGTQIIDRVRNTTSQALRDMPAHAHCVTETELRDAFAYPHLTLGSHSWSHPNLTQLPADELRDELQASSRWLTERFSERVLPVISYPYGRANMHVWEASKKAGYQMGLMVEGGWTKFPCSTPYAVPRSNIPSGVSSSGFTLRTSGVISE